jgi:hypothetical protein
MARFNTGKQIPGLILFSFLIFFTGYSLVSGQSVAGQDSVSGKKAPVKQPVYTTSRLVTAKPVIDGKLNDECWTKGNWAGNFRQWIPNEGAKPTYQTEFNIQYDDRNLYVAIRSFDGEPKKILRQAGVRDEFAGDLAGINFDSYRDYRTGFEFTVSAWGQKVDLVLFNPDNWDLTGTLYGRLKQGLKILPGWLNMRSR